MIKVSSGVCVWGGIFTVLKKKRNLLAEHTISSSAIFSRGGRRDKNIPKQKLRADLSETLYTSKH